MEWLWVIAKTVLILAAIAFVLGVLLAVASKIFAVKKDEREEAVVGCLPGANCGACGFAGCSAYASAEIFWKSSDENIVTVSADGTAAFVSVGKATVSACDADGNVLETLEVEIKERPAATENGVSKESLNRLFFILFAVFAVIGLLCAGTFIFARSRKISANAESEEQPISNDSETEKDAESAEKEE